MSEPRPTLVELIEAFEALPSPYGEHHQLLSEPPESRRIRDALFARLFDLPRRGTCHNGKIYRVTAGVHFSHVLQVIDLPQEAVEIDWQAAGNPNCAPRDVREAEPMPVRMGPLITRPELVLPEDDGSGSV